MLGDVTCRWCAGRGWSVAHESECWCTARVDVEPERQALGERGRVELERALVRLLARARAPQAEHVAGTLARAAARGSRPNAEQVERIARVPADVATRVVEAITRAA